MAGKPVPTLTEAERRRFFAKVLCGPTAGSCMTWTGAVGKNGYGEVKIQGRVLGVHRVAYVLAHGQIDPELVLDHRGPDGFGCVSKLCVNPAHLEPVAARVNNDRQLHRGERELDPITEPEQRSLLPA